MALLHDFKIDHDKVELIIRPAVVSLGVAATSPNIKRLTVRGTVSEIGSLVSTPTFKRHCLMLKDSNMEGSLGLTLWHISMILKYPSTELIIRPAVVSLGVAATSPNNKRLSVRGKVSEIGSLVSPAQTRRDRLFVEQYQRLDLWCHQPKQQETVCSWNSIRDWIFGVTSPNNKRLSVRGTVSEIGSLVSPAQTTRDFCSWNSIREWIFGVDSPNNKRLSVRRTVSEIGSLVSTAQTTRDYLLVEKYQRLDLWCHQPKQQETVCSWNSIRDWIFGVDSPNNKRLSVRGTVSEIGSLVSTPTFKRRRLMLKDSNMEGSLGLTLWHVSMMLKYLLRRSFINSILCRSR